MIPQMEESGFSVLERKSDFRKSRYLTEIGAETFTFLEGRPFGQMERRNFQNPPLNGGAPPPGKPAQRYFRRYKTPCKAIKWSEKVAGLRMDCRGTSVEKDLASRKRIWKKISIWGIQPQVQETRHADSKRMTTLTEEFAMGRSGWSLITLSQSTSSHFWSRSKRTLRQGLIYKGYTIQPYSPAQGRVCLRTKLKQRVPTMDVKDTSITAQFKLKGEEKLLHLSWRTTPWRFLPTQL